MMRYYSLPIIVYCMRIYFDLSLHCESDASLMYVVIKDLMPFDVLLGAKVNASIVSLALNS